MALLLSTQVVANPLMDDAYDAIQRGDTARAIQIWQTLANDNNQTAQLNLGQLYRLGQGVEQNDQEAIKWYTLAANNGSEIARYTLVLMHQENRATDEDLARAGLELKPQQPQETTTPATSWLAQQNPDALLIQIIAASQKERLEKFVADKFSGNSTKPRIVHTHRNGKDWFSLVAGPYNDRDTAQQAMEALPQAAKANGPWIRTAKSLQDTEVNPSNAIP